MLDAGETEMHSDYRMAIIGAGVAGMALAILARKQGYQVSLYEKNSQISSMGAGLTLWPNALFVLQQMGLDQRISDTGGKPLCLRQSDAQGIEQMCMDISTINRHAGYPSVTILRRDLMRILADELQRLGVGIHFNASVTLNGVERLKQDYDLVVGADGRMASVVRQWLYGSRVTPRYQGFVNIIGISDTDDLLSEPAIQDFRGDRQRFGIVPVKARRCFWAAAWPATFDRQRSVAEWVRELESRFCYWATPVQKVLQRCDKRSLKRIFVHDLDPLPFWHRENVLVIGDAAHAPLPTSGQGACQALEDAWHLIRLLTESECHQPKRVAVKSSLDKTLQAFYQCRIDKVSAAQAAGRALADHLFSASSEVGSAGAHSAGITARVKVDETIRSPLSASEISISRFWMQGLIDVSP